MCGLASTKRSAGVSLFEQRTSLSEFRLQGARKVYATAAAAVGTL